eukprot:m.27604 g.27604  ORF g.27604 m.27604 type:complete len:420 (+) comp8948_c1_seq1:194-1453(+)
MSAKHTSMQNTQSWETAEFPILCESCLGPNPYVRMTKQPYGKACKICDRPFTVFRWCPGEGMRTKKTEICQTCSKLKNVCQTCLLDLEYGLPAQVRDSILEKDATMPTSKVNKEYYIQNQEALLAKSGGLEALDSGSAGAGAGMSAGKALLEKMARRQPYYERNRAHICSFWVKGECKRGDLCPFRHELPKDPTGPLAKQNIRDRYYGTNDPVAEKMLKRAKTAKMDAPEDRTITTLFVGGLKKEYGIAKSDIQDVFYQFGEIGKITIAQAQNSAFVQFTTRAAAERAAEGLFGKLNIKGHSLKVMWGRGKKKTQGPPASDAPDAPVAVPPLPGLPGAVPMPPGMSMPPGLAPSMPPGFAMPPRLAAPPAGMMGPRGPRPAYPSMNPARMGARGVQPAYPSMNPSRMGARGAYKRQSNQ